MVDQIQLIIERLKDGVFVTHEAPDNENQGYPYATGYSRSVMQGVIVDLQRVVEQLQEDEAND